MFFFSPRFEHDGIDADNTRLSTTRDLTRLTGKLSFKWAIPFRHRLKWTADEQGGLSFTRGQ
jgi:hypothetical protein